MQLLLPGRHHLLTTDLLAHLTLLLAERKVTAVLWAITSANHQNTRRNPLPGHRREAAIDAFAAELDAPSFVYHIDDIGDSPRYADYILKKVDVDSRGRFRLGPADTIVATGTPELAGQFIALGYKVVPAEPEGGVAPWEVQARLVEAGLGGADLEAHPEFLTRVSRASRRLWVRYGYLSQLVDLHRHPVGTDDGDLTATRDYNVYTRAFDEGAGRKAALIRGHVRPGRVVDVGCCTGSLIQQLCREPELRESDFYGIEMARPLYEECLHRKRQGAFANDHVFFHQANAAEDAVFAANSVDTFLTFSLTHELESYQGRAFLERFIGLLHSQLCIGGRWLNVDVVGPEGGDEAVRLWLREDDGVIGDDSPLPEGRAEMKACLAGLSTLGRFLRFARDFRHAEGYRLEYTLERTSEGAFAVLPLRDACEFLSKKDYLDNWRSEMHEAFCYWGFGDWRVAVERAGFRVMPASHAFTNPWIVANRYEGKVRLLRGGEAMPWPVTNMLLVAEKR
jgi:hypothetical protein